MTRLAFLDTETTGLDPDVHEIWEVALILRTYEDQECERPAHADGHHGPSCHAYDVAIDVEYVWQLPVDLGRGDPIGLNVGRFHERRWPAPMALENHRAAVSGQWPETGGLARCRLDLKDMWRWAEAFTELTRGAHLVGNVVSFDEERLRRMLRRLGQCPMWHYHLVDVECLIAGYLAGRHRGHSPEGPLDDRAQLARPPWDSEELSAALGVNVAEEDRHTALGDARWARAIYDAIVGL